MTINHLCFLHSEKDPSAAKIMHLKPATISSLTKLGQHFGLMNSSGKRAKSMAVMQKIEE